MASLRKAVLASAILATGLVGSTGMAMADTHGTGDTHSREDGHVSQSGLVNSKKVAPNTNPGVCNNDLQGNALGVQVPFNEIAPAGSILSGGEDGSTSPGFDRGCTNPAAS